MESKENKKQRGANFTPSENNLLLKITNANKIVLENKKTDGVTWRMKDECWRRIENKFNSCSSGPPRSAKQLKMKYEGIKKNIKKKYSEHKQYLKGTGGGKSVPVPTPSSEEEKELTETIILSVKGLENISDSDAGIDRSCVNEVETTDINEKNVIVCEWDNFHVDMLQTPLHPELIKTVQGTDHAVNNISDEITKELDCENTKTTDKTGEQNQNKTEKDERTWTSRRRPIIKKRTQKSTALKFEELAERKQKLIEELKKQCEEQIKQSSIEHEMKVGILKDQKKHEEIRIAIAKHELEMAEIKLSRLKNCDFN